jgi:hypothetical protein
MVILKFIIVVTYAHSYNYVANIIIVKLNSNYLIPKLGGTPDTTSQKRRGAAAAAAEVAAVAAVDNNWQLMHLATKALTVA